MHSCPSCFGQASKTVARASESAGCGEIPTVVRECCNGCGRLSQTRSRRLACAMALLLTPVFLTLFSLAIGGAVSAPEAAAAPPTSRLIADYAEP